MKPVDENDVESLVRAEAPKELVGSQTKKIRVRSPHVCARLRINAPLFARLHTSPAPSGLHTDF
jgi:hypothetical protein